MVDVSLPDRLRQADAQVRALRVEAFKRLRPGLICGCEGCRRVGRKIGQGFGSALSNFDLEKALRHNIVEGEGR